MFMFCQNNYMQFQKKNISTKSKCVLFSIFVIVNIFDCEDYAFNLWPSTIIIIITEQKCHTILFFFLQIVERQDSCCFNHLEKQNIPNKMHIHKKKHNLKEAQRNRRA